MLNVKIMSILKDFSKSHAVIRCKNSNICKTVQDRDNNNDKQEKVIMFLSNGANTNDLEWP